jgi:hypothetical protein
LLTCTLDGIQVSCNQIPRSLGGPGLGEDWDCNPPLLSGLASAPNMYCYLPLMFVGASSDDDQEQQKKRSTPTMYVVALSDCNHTNPGVAGVIQRDIEYHAFWVYSDGYTQKVTGDGKSVIDEHLRYVSGSKPPSSSSKPGQPFEDNISVGRSADFQLVQTFTVNLGAGAVDARIQSLKGEVANSNNIRATKTMVTINRDGGQTCK